MEAKMIVAISSQMPVWRRKAELLTFPVRIGGYNDGPPAASHGGEAVVVVRHVSRHAHTHVKVALQHRRHLVRLGVRLRRVPHAVQLVLQTKWPLNLTLVTSVRGKIQRGPFLLAFIA